LREAQSKIAEAKLRRWRAFATNAKAQMFSREKQQQRACGCYGEKILRARSCA
jgi:hypothetical protein